MELTDQLVAEYKGLIGKDVEVLMDRPIGAIHPKHPEIIYPINYGYIDGLLGGDGEEQDVYVLGVTTPLEKFNGKIIAVIHRYDDDECKWVASDGTDYTIDEIEKIVHFQEQFHQSIVIK